MKLAAFCIAAIALSGCASQHGGSMSNMPPAEKAAIASALLSRWQPVQAYQQPFYPMQTVPRSGFSCSRVGSLVSCY